MTTEEESGRSVDYGSPDWTRDAADPSPKLHSGSSSARKGYNK